MPTPTGRQLFGKIHLENLAELSSALTALIDLVLKKHRPKGLEPGSVVVLVQARGRKNLHGWFEPRRWEHRAGYENLHEITVAAEGLSDRGPAGAAATTLHELVHLLCFLRAIKDTSRQGRYHNADFKSESEKLGLMVHWEEKRGYADTSLGAALAAEIAATGLLPPRLFKLQRITRPAAAANSRRSWRCGCRNTWKRYWTVVTTGKRELSAKCLACGEAFVPVKPDSGS